LEHTLLPGVPLTEAQSLEAECLDDLCTGVDFSPKVTEPLVVLIFWELVISQHKGVDVCSRRIKQQKKVAKVTKAVALMDM